MRIIIRPCLLGFQIYTQAAPNGFIRPAGLFSHFTEVMVQLIWTEGDFTLELR